MMFSLLIHLTGVTDLAATTCTAVDACDNLVGLPLSFFSNKGPGTPVKEFLAGQTFTFQRNQDQLAFRFATSRKRNASKLELYFTNPARAFYGDLNYIAVTLPGEWLALDSPRVVEQKVCAFVERVVPFGRIVDASFNHDEIAHNQPAVAVQRAFHRAYHYHPGHISYADAAFLSAFGGARQFTEAGFRVRPISETGFLLVLPLKFEDGPVPAGWRLFDALEAAGTFSRPGTTSHDLSTMVELDRLGNFLETFEAKFGRRFAIEHRDGLHPIQTPPKLNANAKH